MSVVVCCRGAGHCKMAVLLLPTLCVEVSRYRGLGILRSFFGASSRRRMGECTRGMNACGLTTRSDCDNECASTGTVYQRLTSVESESKNLIRKVQSGKSISTPGLARAHVCSLKGREGARRAEKGTSCKGAVLCLSDPEHIVGMICAKRKGTLSGLGWVFWSARLGGIFPLGGIRASALVL